jgi:hypothetical protein
MRYSYKKGLVKLTEYAEKQGYKVRLDYHDISYMKQDTKTKNEPQGIFIQSGMTYEETVYIFLHEMGHHELRKDWDKFKKRLPVLAHAEMVKLYKKENKYSRRKVYHVSSLEEEFLAWDEGLKLAKKLGIQVNMEHWIKIKSKCLKSYIRYYANLKS